MLGGGPSLEGFDCKPLHRLGWLLAINSSFKLAPYCDAVFFTDTTWWSGSWVPGGKPRKVELKRSGALLVTTSRAVKRDAPDHVKRVAAAMGVPFRAGQGPIRLGRSSGHTGVSLAAAFGAKRIILLGFDMKRDQNGRSHHHNEYASVNDKLYSHDFVPSFNGWNKIAVKAGIEILNATPGTALKEFPLIKIEEVLK